MSRRIVIGNVGGVWDARMARPGYDAALDDVNDRRKISFAASRATFGKQGEANTITAADTWCPLSVTYSGIPAVVAVLRNGADTYSSPIRVYSNVNNDRTAATAFVLVVEQGRVIATAPVKSVQTFQSGDFFNFFSVL